MARGRLPAVGSLSLETALKWATNGSTLPTPPLSHCCAHVARHALRIESNYKHLLISYYTFRAACFRLDAKMSFASCIDFIESHGYWTPQHTRRKADCASIMQIKSYMVTSGPTNEEPPSWATSQEQYDAMTHDNNSTAMQIMVDPSKLTNDMFWKYLPKFHRETKLSRERQS